MSEYTEAAPSGWEVTTVDSVSLGNFNIDMALDDDGNPYIAYIDGAGLLRCAHFANTTGWTTTTVSTDPAGYYSQWTNVALDLDASGYPHMVFLEWNDTISESDLVYASYSPSTGWSKEIIVAGNSDPGATDQSFVSIAINSDGVAMVVYRDLDGYPSYITNEGGAWGSGTIFGGYSMNPQVMDIDSSSLPHVGSYGESSGRFILSVNDGSWSHQTVSQYLVNDYTPMVLDHNDEVQICYHAYDGSYSSMGLYYLRENAPSWTNNELIYDGPVGYMTSIAVDSDSNPHIICPDDYTGEIKYFWNTTGTWANSTMYTAAEDNEILWPCLALDRFDNPCVAFVENDYNADQNYLRFARSIAVNPPSVPTNFQGVPGDGRIDLSWGPVENDGGSPVLGYNIYRGLSPGSETLFNAIDDGSIFSYSNTGLVNGITYYYQLSAYNSEGEGALSAEISYTPVEGPSEPSAPRNFTAVPSSGRVDLSWDTVEDDGGVSVTGYRIYSGTTSGGETFLTAITSGSTFSYSHTGLLNGVKFYYQISALNAIGEGNRSTEISATPIGVPGAPVDLVAHRGDAEVKLVWKVPFNDGGSPIVNYTIYRSTTSNTEVKLLSIGVATNYTDTTVSNDQRYYYKVTATNAIGEGPKSGETSTVPSDNMTPVITLGYDAGMPGNWISISGTGFDSNSPCALYFGTYQVLWTNMTDPYGSFTDVFKVPNIANGTYLVRVEDSSGYVAYENFTIGQPVIFLGTDNGSPGVMVSISGYGFKGDAALKLRVGTFLVLWPGDTNSSGAFDSNFKIPDLPSGDYEVTVTDPYGNTAAANLEIGIPIIILGYDSGCLDAVIPISGSGFAPNAHLSLYIGDWHVLFNPLTDANGSFSSNFKVPDLADGVYLLNVSDPNYHLAMANFAIGTPRITLGSENGSPRVDVPIQGYGFHPDSALSLYIGTFHVLWSATTDDAGAFNSTFRVPDLSSGEYDVNVTDNEGYSGYAEFELGMPSIAFGIPTGCPGAVLPISGAGFSPTSNLQLSFAGTRLLWSVTTNSIGSFSSTFMVPQVDDGTYLVNVTDTGYHLASANFTVGEPKIEMGDLGGAPGTEIPISGQGFAPNSQLQLYIGSEQVLWSVQTDASGSFSSTFQVPELVPGSYDIEIRDATGHNATGEVEVSSPEEQDDGPGRLVYAGIGAIILVGAGAAVMLFRKRRIR
ncbi:MAG: fibronectin type III domain-containing protein [Methanomassiliicoccales archaeon]